ncbi:MAG TPA: hypothetical protein PLU39_00240 [Armatimonadota bacterium]|jgi:ABC-type transport system involved in cytochrome c biogenesis permease component|nr:hypothetical protein [Armatimonadota bacterium]HOM83023.1 hypothetical protein [Armatimonadota bacterium]HOQ28093.1 hypothetical protein [Armatimonadota bacterium]HPO71775.1 hypothetical protein [Armatimonadota bacterium]HPT96275.1 hypothetical protein [Armatimonadota bacterium]
MRVPVYTLLGLFGGAVAAFFGFWILLAFGFVLVFGDGNGREKWFIPLAGAASVALWIALVIAGVLADRAAWRKDGESERE